MKPLLILLFLFPAILAAQQEHIYLYNGAGNRILRQQVYPKKPETQMQKQGNYTIKVFPNPASKYLV